MTTLADTFNRADSSSTINPASDGGTWTVSGVYGITTNRGNLANTTGGSEPTSSTIARRDLGSNGADMTVDITRGSNTGAGGLWISYDPSTNQGYFLQYDGSAAFGNIKRVGSSTTTLGAHNLTDWTGGTTTLRFTHDGAGVVKLYQGGTLKATYTDGSPLTAGTWVGFGTSVASVDFWDNFTATSVTPPASAYRRPALTVRSAAVRRASVI